MSRLAPGSLRRCPGPLHWFDVPDEIPAPAAVLECARDDCDYLVVTATSEAAFAALVDSPDAPAATHPSAPLIRPGTARPLHPTGAHPLMGDIPFHPGPGDLPEGWPPDALPDTYECRHMLAQGERHQGRLRLGEANALVDQALTGPQKLDGEALLRAAELKTRIGRGYLALAALVHPETPWPTPREPQDGHR